MTRTPSRDPAPRRPPPVRGQRLLEEAEENQADFEDMMETMIGPGTCRDAGGLEYADDYRCEDDRVQILCEKA